MKTCLDSTMQADNPKAVKGFCSSMRLEPSKGDVRMSREWLGDLIPRHHHSRLLVLWFSPCSAKIEARPSISPATPFFEYSSRDLDASA